MCENPHLFWFVSKLILSFADEVEEVEHKCQEVIRTIEQAVNEDLQKYF